MARSKPIRIVGKPAKFSVEHWARAIEALALQLHREWSATGNYPVPPTETDAEEPREAC